MSENALVPVTVDISSKELEMVEFSISANEKDNFFGINVLKVQEVLKIQESDLTKVPGAPDNVLGVVRIRENIISVVDMKDSLFGESSMDGGSGPKMLLHCHLNSFNFGFIVDKVIGIRRIIWGDVIDESSIMTSDAAANCIIGIIKQDDHLIQLIDFEAIINRLIPDMSDRFLEQTIRTDINDLDSLQKHHFLFADDSLVTRNTLKRICEKFSIRYTMTKNGKDLLDAFNPQEHTCIVSDIEMPVMDGISAVKNLRDNRHMLPVILFSSLSDTVSSAMENDIGLSGVIKKPDYDSLLDMMKHV